MAMTFRVNLQTLNYLNTHHPYNQHEGENFRTLRSTYIPDYIRRNRILKDGDLITVSGQEALYLLRNYTQGEFKCLDFVSGTA